MELDEAKALVLTIDTIDGHVYVPYPAGIEHELMENSRRDAFMKISDIYGSFLVLLPARALASVCCSVCDTYQWRALGADMMLYYCADACLEKRIAVLICWQNSRQSSLGAVLLVKRRSSRERGTSKF